MKLLITSNILIGQDFSHLALVADRMREVRHDALREIISLAEHEKVDALFLLGNTLADNRISQHDIHEVANTLSGSKVPVYILPGSKDPYTPDSPYRYMAEKFTGNVIVLGRSKPFKIVGYTFYPYPVRSRDQQFNSLFESIDTKHKKKKIVLIPQVNDFGKLFHEVEKKGLQSVFCGGQFDSNAKDDVIMAGCPENTDFDQPSASVGIVKIEGKDFFLQAKEINQIHWKKFEYDSSEIRSLSEDIAQVSNIDSTLLKIIARGSLPVEDFLEVESVLEQAEDRCFSLQRDLGVKLQFPKTANPLLAQIVSDINKQIEQETTDDLPFSPIPSAGEVCRYAQLYLYKLISQSNNRDFK